jgi:hypothetical protein
MALSQKKLAQKRFKKKLARKAKKYNPQKHFIKPQTVIQPESQIADTELLDLTGKS